MKIIREILEPLDNNCYILVNNGYALVVDPSSEVEKIENVLNKFTPEERKYFTTTFFNLLYTSGYTLKSELKEISLTRMKNLIKETTNLNEKERKILLEMFKTITKNTTFEEENKKKS